MSGRRVVGVDESGKGDFFGPLVVAAFLAPDDACPMLVKAGVRDGKKLSDNRVLDLDEFLRKDFAHQLVVIDPEQYNARYKNIRNLNKLLAHGHGEAISGVLEQQTADLIVVDQFGKTELVESVLRKAGVSVEVNQRFRGEEIVQVAAASILARAAFIREIKRLSGEYHVDIPKGASAQVDRVGRELVHLYGVDVLTKLSKTHFKNFSRASSLTLFSK
ncbi:MAG: ribonuclease HIII [candidate division Zixibacteria bacterium]|nr:ribonuclease HIII [candidate division Zixibacteria bacterium]